MGKRKSFKNEIHDYIVTTAGCGVVFYSISAATAYYGDGYFDLVWPALAAASAPVIVRLLNAQSRPKLAVSLGHTVERGYVLNRPGRFDSLVKWSSGGYSPDKPLQVNSRQIRYDEPLPMRYFWDVQLTNRLQPVRVWEDDLHIFVERASRRQRNNNPAPLSRNYFTPRPFSEAEYNALVEILKSCGLIYNRGQGASGKLAYPRQISFTVEYAKRYYSPLPD